MPLLNPVRVPKGRDDREPAPAAPGDDAHCGSCSLADLCLPGGLTPSELRELDAVVDRKRPVAAGQEIVRPGQPQTSLFAVRQGWVKTYRLGVDGDEHIIAFHMPGELFGLESLHERRHLSFATPVTGQALLCELPVERLDELCRHLPSLGQQLTRLMSREMETLGVFHQGRSADRSLARFIQDLLVRQQRMEGPADRLDLAMSRREIASFLRMTPETVSRVFRRMRDLGTIELRGRHLRVLNPDALQISCSD